MAASQSCSKTTNPLLYIAAASRYGSFSLPPLQPHRSVAHRSVATTFREQHRPHHAVNITSEASSYNVVPTADVLRVWKSATAVCFDVDSTVFVDEGIDELADFCGAGEAVAEWTNKAMGGSVPFEVALFERLNLFKPSADDVARFLATHPPRLSPGIFELVEKMTSQGKAVYLISGGFRQMIEPAAQILGIPKERIFANRLLFDESGHFSGFDTDEPTSRSGGKSVAVKNLKQKFGYQPLVMIGDGATDLEARTGGGADVFIGYGGVQVRQKVAEGADWFVYNFQDLIDALD